MYFYWCYGSAWSCKIGLFGFIFFNFNWGDEFFIDIRSTIFFFEVWREWDLTLIYILFRRTVPDLSCKLVNIASDQILLNDLKLSFVFVMLLLLVNNQSISVFKSIFSPAVEKLDDFWPLFWSLVLLYAFQELNILFRLPWTFFKVWVQVTVPMLSALFGISEDFVISIVQEIQSLRDHLPIFCVFGLSLKAFLRN